jgi:hypothetical protein
VDNPKWNLSFYSYSGRIALKIRWVLCLLCTVSDCSVKSALKDFLTNSAAFYSKMMGQVEAQLSFSVLELLSNQVVFTSKTHCRKVRGRGRLLSNHTRGEGEGRIAALVELF